MTQKLLDLSINADELVNSLLNLSEREIVCLLDGGAANLPNSRFLIAGIAPVETHEIKTGTAAEILNFLDEKLAKPDLFHILTVAYDFGLKLENIEPSAKLNDSFDEPLIFSAAFETIIIHDYLTDKTFLIGSENNFKTLENKIAENVRQLNEANIQPSILKSQVTANLTKTEYLEKIEQIKELIRVGDTYQTNLTLQFRAALAPELLPQTIFRRLRRNNPASFSAFIQRPNSTVVSASPESFFEIRDSSEIQDSRFEIQDLKLKTQNPIITVAPVKGTMRRGANAEEDSRLRVALSASEKDRAENLMIVDLLRNDLGRICRFGSISAEKLCEIETLPTLHHLVSTVRGELVEGVKFSDILKALFPCGSITGAPKISTMKIIDRLETASRGLSMGAIGFSNNLTETFSSKNNPETYDFPLSVLPQKHFSVAIRTMTVCGNQAVFNVGGGIVIDSDPESEYEEILTKAKAIFDALNTDF